jgi:phosphate transport system substrate-binding protein
LRQPINDLAKSPLRRDFPVTITRYGRLAGVALAAALALAACGSDSNSSSGGTSTGSISCQSGSIKASGSTAQKNAMAQWVANYQQACSGATIDYSPSGSGAGVQDFINNQTAFAGSDSALKPDEQTSANKRCGSGNVALNIPMVVGPIAVAYNVSGVSSLTMTPQVLAQIFAGKVTKWNDQAIASINSGVTLPNASIITFHRSDSSGTTDNFTKYLSAAAASDWTYGHDKVWKAPGGQGAKGSDGVATAIKSTPNAMGYVEYSFAKQDNLTIAKIDNGGGAVELTPDAAGKAVDAAKIVGTGQDLTLQLDYTTKVAGAYPIVLVTYEITCQKGLSSSDLGLTKSFLTYTSSSSGQGVLTADLGYAPLPASLLTKVQASVASIS